MVEFNRKKYIIGVIPVIILFAILGFLFVNQFRGKSHCVTRLDSLKAYKLVSCVGYESSELGRLGDEFRITDPDNHYVTIEVDWETKDFTVVFLEPTTEDTNIHVWYCLSDGQTLEEEDITWKKGEQLIWLSVPNPSTGLIALQIDRDFKLCEGISSYSVDHSRKIKILTLAYIIAMAVIIIGLFAVKPFKKFFVGLYNKLANAKDYLKNHKKGLAINFLIMLESLGVSTLIVFVLSCINATFVSRTINFNYKNIVVVFALLWIIELIIINRKNLAEKYPFYAALIIFIVGMAYIIVEPSFIGTSWDEESHFRNVTNLVHIADKEKPFYESNMIFLYGNTTFYRETYKEGYDKAHRALFDVLENEGFFCEYDYHFKIQSLVYLPPAIGVFIASSLRLPATACVDAGRLTDILFLAIISYFAMKKLKKGWLIILMFMLIPTNIALAANYCYDTWLTALMVLGTSYYLAELQDSEEKISKVSFLLIPFAMLIGNLYKQIYFILIFPALFLPLKKFKDKKNCWIYRIVVLFATFFPFISVFMSHIINAGAGDWRGGEDVNSAGQVAFIKGHILYFIELLFNFLKYYLNPLNWALDEPAYLGPNRVGIGVFILVILVIGAVLVNRDKKWNSIPILLRLLYIAIYIGMGVLCATAMYISFNGVGSSSIKGCQGRYILPAIFPLLYVCTKVTKKVKFVDKIGETNINIVFAIIMVAVNAYCMYFGCSSVY